MRQLLDVVHQTEQLPLRIHLLSPPYPRIHAGGLNPTQALEDYFEAYVQRDLRQLMAIKDLALFEKFVRLCAGRVGQLLNLHSLAADTEISHPTARAWISLLEASYVVFLLQPDSKRRVDHLDRRPGARQPKAGSGAGNRTPAPSALTLPSAS